jgi:GNAT superfamily N-acetyltransferase
MSSSQKPTDSTAKVRVIELSRLELDQIAELNQIIFHEERIINRIDHEHMIILMLLVNDMRAGFKIGYSQANGVFYSAKGGILPAFRRRGYATLLLDEMMRRALELQFRHLRYDTFPNQHPEMLILGLKSAFKVVDAGWNDQHRDYRVTLSVSIQEYLSRRADPAPDDGQ